MKNNHLILFAKDVGRAILVHQCIVECAINMEDLHTLKKEKEKKKEMGLNCGVLCMHKLAKIKKKISITCESKYILVYSKNYNPFLQLLQQVNIVLNACIIF